MIENFSRSQHQRSTSKSSTFVSARIVLPKFMEPLRNSPSQFSGG